MSRQHTQAEAFAKQGLVPAMLLQLAMLAELFRLWKYFKISWFFYFKTHVKIFYEILNFCYKVT